MLPSEKCVNGLLLHQHVASKFDNDKIQSEIDNKRVTKLTNYKTVSDEVLAGETFVLKCNCSEPEKLSRSCSKDCQTHFTYQCQNCKKEKVAKSTFQEIDCQNLNANLTKDSSTGFKSYQHPDNLSSIENLSSGTYADSIASSSNNFFLPQRQQHFQSDQKYLQNYHSNQKSSSKSIDLGQWERKKHKNNWKRNNCIFHSVARRNAYLLAKQHPYKPKAIYNRRNAPDNFYSALFTMICCCFPLGLASLIFSCKSYYYQNINVTSIAQSLPLAEISDKIKSKSNGFYFTFLQPYFSALGLMTVEKRLVLSCGLSLVAWLKISFKVRAYRADGNYEMAQQSSLLGRKLANTGIMLGMLAIVCALFYFFIDLNIPYVSVEYSNYIPEYYN